MLLDPHHILFTECASRLLEKSRILRNPPKRILHIGCGKGYLDILLQKQYPQAMIINMDVSPKFCARKPLRFWQKKHAWGVAGNIVHLPFKQNSFDGIFIMGPLAQNDAKILLAPLLKVLSADGVLFFVTFGPNTGKQTPYALPALTDMHDWGDALLSLGFKTPVMDAQIINFSYNSDTHLKTDIAQLYTSLNIPTPKTVPFTPILPIELVFGHAFAPIRNKSIIPIRTEDI